MSRRRGFDIAIVGMACRFPGAVDLASFAENILGGVDAITDVPPDRWDPAVFFDPDSTANDRVPCRRGGYLADPVSFDPTAYGIMPNAVEGGEPEQFLILEAARDALLDAGLSGPIPDAKRVQVIVGRGNYFNRGNLTRLQHGRIVAQTLAVLESLHPEWTEGDLEAVRLDLKSSLPPFEPASVPGQLTNATAGRVANRLDLGGASYVVDAASASSLVALDLGAKALTGRRADLVLVGGVYLEADVDFPLVFRQLGALSRSGRSRPFARDADGMLSGEGVGLVVLKRRLDAEHDGDRVYAVLKGIGVASDGRGSSLTAPSARGHARAIRRAYRSSDVDPSSVGLIEGHGLGVPAADRAELRALRAVFPPIARGRRVLGAVSSMIGHAMPAAGIAGLIKAALSLHHRVLPPTLNADSPHPLLERLDSPLALNLETRPWVHGDPSTPRRAGVNAFGFAGINAHAVLEEHPGSADGPGALLRWESEAILLSADDRAGLIRRVESLRDWLRLEPEASMKDVAFTINTASPGPCRVGLVARSLEDLSSRLEVARTKLLDPGCRSIRDARGSYFWDRAAGPTSRLAFLFPGEGSQYPGMLADLCPHFPEVRALFDTSDRIARESGSDTWPSERLFARASEVDPGLWSAEVAVNVVLSAQWGMYQLLGKLGLRPDAVVGHSSGELLALAASGAVEVDRSFEAKLGELGAIFGRLETSGELPEARLVAVASSREKVEPLLSGDVRIAMDNCPHQVVIAGNLRDVGDVVGRLKLAGMLWEDLPFSRAYHTPSFAPALGPIASFFDSLPIQAPKLPIYSCASRARMPDDPGGIRRLAVEQWTKAVGFRDTIEAMYADGLDVLVDVGARGNLAGFSEDTLRGRPAYAVAANLPRRSGLTQLNHLVASLFAKGVDLRPDHLYARRRPTRVDFEVSPTRKKPPSLKLGFPTMTLSQGLIDRLATTSPDLEPPANGRPEDDHSEENLWPASSPTSPSWVEPTGSHANSNGYQASTASVETLVPPSFALEETETTLFEFQETMAAFLRTQQDVMDAFLRQGRARSDEDEVSFHVSGRQDDVPAGPWSGELISLVEGSEATAIVTLEVAGDPVAEHHTLGGRRVSNVHREWRGLPVLPFAVMAEMLAEAASRLRSGQAVVALRDVRARRWIRYEPEPIALEIHAVADLESPSSVRVAIHNRGPAVAMRPIEPPVFEGVVEFGEVRPSPIAERFDLEDSRACRFTPESIYGEQWLFHGPAFQAVVGIGPIARGGINGTLRVLPFAPLLGDGLDPSGVLLDPIILDNFTHLLGGWGLDELADRGDVIFPLRMGELAIFGDRPALGTDVSCRIRVREVERHRVLVDADLVRPDGSTWMSLRGWEDWRFHWPGRFRDGFRSPDRTFLGEPLELPVEKGRASAVWLEPPLDMGRPVWRDVLEHVQLGLDERAAYLAMPGPDFRRTHRLWGRIAAKEAARRIWLEQGGPPVYPADLIVERDPLGRPWLRTRLDPGPGAIPSISIAHVDGVAVALASLDPLDRPGIDVEPIVERSSTFESTAFTPGERSLLEGRTGPDRAEWVARFWCAKESVAKATGLGFADGPSGVEVVRASADGVIGVVLRGGLLEARPEWSDRVIRVTSALRGDFVWAWTLGREIES